MTPEQHNKTVGICHIAYGVLTLLMLFGMLVFIWAIGGPGGDVPDSELPVILGIFFGVMLIYSLIFLLPSFIAGYAMLKRKSWARMASLIAAVLEVMSFPFGTAVGVYSFWFMFSEVGKSLYGDVAPGPVGARPYALHDAPPPPASDWNAQTSTGREYVPPTQPPDWRNQ